MAVMIRLASAELHPFEIAFFRNLFGFAFALPLLLRHGIGLLRTSHLSLYFVRCLIGIGSMLCGFGRSSCRWPRRSRFPMRHRCS